MARKRSKPLRKIADSFVVAPPSGVRIRTKIPHTPEEHAKLIAISTCLGTEYREDLAFLLKRGGKVERTYKDKDGKECKVTDYDRARRKQEMTARTSSRWAGTITRASQDQYELGMRNLEAQQEYLEAATGTLSSRLAIGVGRKIGRVRGYRDEREWYSKRRRLGVLQDRIPDIERRLVEKHPAIVLGGRDTLKRHNNLRALDMTDWQYELAEERWRQDWDASRLFLTADGESGVTGGNSTIQVLASGKLAINYPGALVSDKKGKKNPRLEIEGLVKFPDKNRGAEWYDRVLAQQAIRYDITYEPRKDCWYIDASWGTPVSEDALPTPHELKNDRHLAIDLNADHLAVCVVDKHGNPVGDPKDVPLALTGCSETRDGILRAAITRLIGIAKANKCTTITVENLNFEDARKTGRETMGRGKRGKKFRKTVAGIPTAKFRERLVSMAYHNGLWVLAVDPAYTSQWGERYWKTVLQKQSSSKVKVTRHHCAAVAIGRRGHGFPIRRRKTGPRNKQRIVASLPNIADLTSETMLHGANAPPNSRSIQSSAKTVKWESAPVLNQHRSGSKNDLVRAQNES